MKKSQQMEQGVSSPWQSQGQTLFWIAFAGRLIAGAVFIFSGFLKAVQPAEEFAAVLEAYYILPRPWLMPFAQTLPWVQLIFGGFLLAGYWTRAAAAVIGGMLVSFLWALGSVVARGVPLDDCGCFGNAVHLSPVQTMVFDAGLLILVFFAYQYGSGRLSLDNWVEVGGEN